LITKLSVNSANKDYSLFRSLTNNSYYVKLIPHTIVLLFITSFQLAAQNQPPVVENVTFTQRTDGSFIVDVYYDVNDPEGEPMTVTMEASDDNGATWNFPCVQVSGDIGTGLTSGTNKQIVWDFGLEHPNEYDDQFRIKIIADDGGIVMGIPCPGTPTVTYEGKTYNTVLIGEQCWLKENLDVGTMINGIDTMKNNSVVEKYCYDDDPNNCNTHGGLYQWDETMQYSTTPGVQGICPPGWHIPTNAEFLTLSTAVGGDGNALKKLGVGWGGGQGTNTSGFSALLAGYRHYIGYFSSLNANAKFWSSTVATIAYNLSLYGGDSTIYFYYNNKDLGISVRCLKD